ncbi:MAG TPA: alpha-L-fucosidase [Armatimonadota bacterium]|jgi:hypothetical protein
MISSHTAIDWPQFLHRHDLVWDTLPTTWQAGAFLGNGLLGAMIYHATPNHLHWAIGRSDVTDHRSGGEDPIYAVPRLPIGELILEPQGQVTSGSMRLDLWNAEAGGTLHTDRGEITWRAYIHAELMTLVVELTTSPGEAECSFRWQPEAAINPRLLIRQEVDNHPNPPCRQEVSAGVQVCAQALTAGGEFATAWTESRVSPLQRVLILSVAQSYPEQTSVQQACAHVNAALVTGSAALRETHQAWWQQYYPASFLSIPDARLESFYWIQMYKLASATRADRSALDNMGPWYHRTAWPATWWNLNIQLAYWPVYDANRLELGESLCRLLDTHTENLIANVPEAYRADAAGIGRVSGADCRGPLDGHPIWGRELCNLPWICHNYWLHYRHTMDDDLLRDRLFPLLRQSINLYLHLLSAGEDGKLHLPLSHSPEYPDDAPDCNIDLALCRWGCQTLLASCARLGLDDPLIPRWREVLARLVDYPTDDTGFMIGQGVPFRVSHRHYSHLLMIYPLRLLAWERVENRELIARSVAHWIDCEASAKRPEEILTGFSLTGAAAMSLVMERPDEALRYLNKLLDDYVQPSTLYVEADCFPCLETPLSAAQVLHEMLLQSWGGVLRIFPAVPTTWEQASFYHLRAEGAFLVSAVRTQGKTQWVRIESLAGEPCRVHIDLPQPWTIIAEREMTLRGADDGTVEIDLRQGECVTMRAAEFTGDCLVAPVQTSAYAENYYGSQAMAAYTSTFGGAQ